MSRSLTRRYARRTGVRAARRARQSRWGRVLLWAIIASFAMIFLHGFYALLATLFCVWMAFRR